jgi:uncharacterized protein (UPF0276 family)
LKIPTNKQAFGLGLRHTHHSYILKYKPKIDFFEIHSENFIAKGGYHIKFLEEISQIYPLSFHSIGLSIGSKCGIEKKHLQDLKYLIDKFNPFLISDHLSWSASSNAISNDLLPIPYNQESLNIFIDNIKKIQDYFGQNIMIENPTSYIEFKDSNMEEVDFINQIAEKSQCNILLDINNIFVTSKNFNSDPKKYINEINIKKIQEIHLAGHIITKIENQEIRIDTHSTHISDEVLELYQYFLTKAKNNIPTLIEWDDDIPEFKILEKEIDKVKSIIAK